MSILRVIIIGFGPIYSFSESGRTMDGSFVDSSLVVTPQSLTFEAQDFGGRHLAFSHWKQAPAFKSFRRCSRLALEKFEPFTIPISIVVTPELLEFLESGKGSLDLFAFRIALSTLSAIRAQSLNLSHPNFITFNLTLYLSSLKNLLTFSPSCRTSIIKAVFLYSERYFSTDPICFRFLNLFLALRVWSDGMNSWSLAIPNLAKSQTFFMILLDWNTTWLRIL